MKKALNITIAGTLFTIEEDAYTTLDEYLKSIHNYFGTGIESDEIIKDIEARIAEQLLEQKTIQGIVTIEGVEKVISTMGRVEDFGDRPESATHSSSTSSEDPTAPRRLFRNSDDEVIAGVASGLASYFGADPLIVRIAFIVLALITSGGAIFLYLLLAIFIPIARTPAEKMQQRGGPVTLQSFKETVKKNSREIVGKDSQFRNFLEKMIRLLGKLVMLALKLTVILICVLLVAGSALALIVATFTFANLALNIHSPYVEFPISQVISGPMYYSLISLAYILAFIPLVLLGALGISIARKKPVLGTRVVAILAAAWIVIAIWTSTLVIRVVPEAREKLMALPQYQEVSAVQNVKDFTKLELHGVDTVKIVQAPEFSVTEHGRQIDVDRTKFEVKNGTLVLTQQSLGHMCYFLCSRNDVEITISMPNVDEIKASGLTEIISDSLAADTMSIKLSDAARATLSLHTNNLNLLTQDAARITLMGTTSSATISAQDVGRVNGENFVITNATVKSQDAARAIVNVISTLNAKAQDVSRITYYGNPQVTQEILDVARVINATSTSEVED